MSDQMGKFDRFLSPTEKDQLFDVISERLSDFIWDDYFYIHEFFDTTTGFTVSSSTSSVSFGIGGVDMITGTSSGDHKEFGRQMPNENTLISHERQTYFRVNAFWGETTNQTSYIRTLYDGPYGSLASLTDEQKYRSGIGFKVENGNLFGISQNNGFETTTFLGTITADQSVQLELRYFDKQRVDFYVDKVFKASITDDLPTSSSNKVSIFEAYIQTDEAAQKDLSVEYYEFLQKRA